MPSTPGRVNFTEREKIQIMTIVGKYMDIVENKITNAATNTLKKRTWEQITNEYNAQLDANTSTMRTPIQIKALYENLKKKSKKDGKDLETFKNEMQEHYKLLVSHGYAVEPKKEHNVSNESADNNDPEEALANMPGYRRIRKKKTVLEDLQSNEPLQNQLGSRYSVTKMHIAEIRKERELLMLNEEKRRARQRDALFELEKKSRELDNTIKEHIVSLLQSPNLSGADLGNILASSVRQKLNE